MAYRTGALIAVVVLSSVFTSSVDGEGQTALPQERQPVLVVFAPFEIKGDATSEVAHAMSERLKELLDANPRIDVAPDAGVEALQKLAQYLVKGGVYAGDGRRFVYLSLLDVRSGDTLWAENYDYTNITADMIAPAIIKAVLK